MPGSDLAGSLYLIVHTSAGSLSDIWNARARRFIAVPGQMPGIAGGLLERRGARLKEPAV